MVHKDGKNRSGSPEWIITEVPELWIVDQDLWEAVKARQTTVKKNTHPGSERPFRERTRLEYFVSGLLKRGARDGSHTKISADLFGCATAPNRGTCDNRLNIRRDDFEAIVLEDLTSRPMAPDLFKEFADVFISEGNRLLGEHVIPFAPRRPADFPTPCRASEDRAACGCAGAPPVAGRWPWRSASASPR